MTKSSLPALLVGLVALLVHASNLGNGFVYDDRYLVERDPRVQDVDLPALAGTSYWGGLRDAGLYRPLTLASFGLNRLFGAAPFGFHLVDDLLHALASVLVLAAARALSARPLAALAAGLLFAVHPALSEAVTTIVGRAEILAFAFTVGALLVFVRGGNAVACGLLVFLALCSKESAAFALPLFLLYPWVFGRNVSPRRYAPLTLAFLLYGALRYAVLGDFGIGDREIGFLDNPLAEASLSTRLLTALALLARYVGLVLWPRTLSADYSFDQIPAATAVDLRVALGAAIAAALVGLAVVARRRGRPGLAFGVAAFLVPLSGLLHVLFPLGTIFAERLLYLPMFGAVLAIGCGFEWLGERHRGAAVGLLVGLVAAGSLRTIDRNRDWRDNETLFARTVETSPRSARSHFLLGAELLEQERFAEAGDAFERGLAIASEHFGALMSLGQARLAAGSPAEAARAFERALEVAPGSGDARLALAEASLEAGRIAARDGRLDEARSAFARARELDPGSGVALNYLGLVAERRGRFEEAAALYEEALEKSPELAEAAVNLASLRMRAGDLAAAETLYRRTLALAPESYEAYNGLGIALARQGKVDEAEAAFRRALEIDPELRAARDNLRAIGREP